MKELRPCPLTVTINNDQPKPPTFEDLGYVQVIRCKDCKYWYFADNRIPCERENVCGRNGIVVTPDWFCADGEQKEGR